MGSVLVARVSVPCGGGVVSGEVTSDPDRLLTGPQIAAMLGIQANTWRSLVRRGYAPVADDPGEGPVNRRTPRWKVSTVREFRLNRPGRGRRRK